MSELIFITGATGFIGSQVANTALKAGYRVRLSVRKEEQIEKLKKVFSSYLEKLEFALVYDITKKGAFDDALKGVDYIFHLASPVPGNNFTDAKKDYFDPAIIGTTNILDAALNVDSIKKVIITSSVVALTPLSGAQGKAIKEDSDFDLSVDVNQDFGQNDFKMYHASKLLADQASTEWMKKNNPKFALVTLHPTFVFGPSLIQQSAQELDGTNALLYNSLKSEQPYISSNSVHVLDVADAHLKALDKSIPSGSKFLLSAPQFYWKDALDFVKKEFPQVNWRPQPPMEEKPWNVDTSKAEKLLGLKWRSAEEQIKDVVNQQLSFSK